MSDKKEKDSKVKSSKAKKNVEKTQEVSVSAEKKIFPHSCTDCGVLNCSKRNASYPEFCLTEKLTEKELEKVVKLYTENEEKNQSVRCHQDDYLKQRRQFSGRTVASFGKGRL